ncbi:hypothetical protein ACO0LC_09770 [Undibacterium sp. JH2W]|uniref:hypothetical protein n=1 Tax=Undibacterium sp. JH2W TaxID=3413037 RepID=UPI003BEFFE4B
MKATNLGSANYVPATLPTDAAELQRFFISELQRISAAINLIGLGHLEKTTTAPIKPRDGDIRYADGISWNPGVGTGIYYYKGATSAWVLLG